MSSTIKETTSTSHMVKFSSDPENKHRLIFERRPKGDTEFYTPEIEALDFFFKNDKDSVRSVLNTLRGDVSQVYANNNTLNEMYTKRFESLESDIKTVGEQTLDSHNQVKGTLRDVEYSVEQEKTCRRSLGNN